MSSGIVTLQEVFGKYFDGVDFDARLSKEVYRYQLSYINSSKEYIEFYGSNLLGVHVVRFKDSDVSKLYDILDIDYIALSNDLKLVTDVNQNFKISSDVFNLTVFYMIHKFMTSKLLDSHKRERASYDCAVLFFYRTIAALMSNNFKYPADPEIAQQAYANLSNKYLIKRLGSWGKVVDYRANDLSGKSGIWHKVLTDFNNDIDIVKAINDSQGRIRDLIKNYYGEFIKVHQSGGGITSKSSTYLDIEGEENVKEKTKSVETYIEYIKNIITDEHSFIKDDLVNIVVKMNVNTSFKSVRTVLKWLSDSYSNNKHHKLVDDFINTSIIHSFYLITYSISPKTLRDYPAILTGLKNLLASSRSTDADLLAIRDLGEKIVKNSFTSHISNPLILATRSSVVLYIILRVLVGTNK